MAGECGLRDTSEEIVVVISNFERQVYFRAKENWLVYVMTEAFLIVIPKWKKIMVKC